MRKRILSLLLALALSAGVLPCAYALDDFETFEDLDADAWYAQGVRFCLKNDLMGGYGYENHPAFGPNDTMTRAQLVTVLWRMEGKPLIGLSMQYNDVEEDIWYAEAVRWALSAGVMGGYDAVTFAPDDPLTREQLAVILWRYAEHRSGVTAAFSEAECARYSDRDEISGYAVSAVSWACGMGILTGAKDRYGQRWLTPTARTTRASVAVMLMRFCLDMGVYD